MRQSIDRKFNLNTTVYQKINIDASRLLESPNIKRWGSIQTFLSDSEQSPNKNILNFIWNYQVKEMYLRYFAWQFAGKEYYKENFSWHRDEASDRGEAIPEPLSNINWYHYGIPFSLIFGLIGMVYHFIKDSRKAFSILVLFLVY